MHLTSILVKSLCSLNKAENVVEIFNDEELRLHIDEKSVFTLMKQLLQETKYSDLVKLFCKYLNIYKANTHEKQQVVPHSHLSLVTTALLQLVC